MDMIRLNVKLQNFNRVFLSEELIYLLSGILGNFTVKDSVTILGTEDNMVLAFIDRM